MPDEPRRTGAALPFGVELEFETLGNLYIHAKHCHAPPSYKHDYTPYDA
jgi:hypothetical protein